MTYSAVTPVYRGAFPPVYFDEAKADRQTHAYLLPGWCRAEKKAGYNAFGQSAVFFDLPDKQVVRLDQQDAFGEVRNFGWWEYPPGCFKSNEELDDGT